MDGLVEVNQLWPSHSGTSGGLTAVFAGGTAEQSVMSFEFSTLASTQSVQLQTASNSSGPWFSEASTSIAITATLKGAVALRVTGPYQWARPFFNSNSTGAYTVRLVGVS